MLKFYFLSDTTQYDKLACLLCIHLDILRIMDYMNYERRASRHARPSAWNSLPNYLKISSDSLSTCTNVTLKNFYLSLKRCIRWNDDLIGYLLFIIHHLLRATAMLRAS